MDPRLPVLAQKVSPRGAEIEQVWKWEKVGEIWKVGSPGNDGSKAAERVCWGVGEQDLEAVVYFFSYSK